MNSYRAEDLRRLCDEILKSFGMPPEDAAVVANSLVRANLEGTDSHGVSRFGIYAKRMREGRIAADPQVGMDRAGSVLRVDGGNGLGQAVCVRALKEAIPLAKENGIAGVAIRNSNHFGTAAYYCQMACREEVALIATTNSQPAIAPWGGREAYLGTNPIAFGFPTRTEPPMVVDMSSSIVARGRIILAAARGQEIPKGWAIDEQGRPTTDAAAALKGAVLPLGGAKGYALAMAVEVMSGVLSGAAFGPHVSYIYRDGDPPANVGHSFILLNVASWLPPEDYYSRIEQFLEEVKNAPPAEGFDEILYPGERRYRSYLEKSECGISLPEEVESELKSLANECGASLPASVD